MEYRVPSSGTYESQLVVHLDGAEVDLLSVNGPQPSASYIYYRTDSLPPDWTQFTNGTHTLEIDESTSGNCLLNEPFNISNIPPTGTVLSPSNQSRVGGKAVALSGTGSADHSAVQRIDFIVGQKLIVSANGATLSASWDTTSDAYPNGIYDLYEKIYAEDGLVGTSPVVQVDVHNADTVLNLRREGSTSTSVSLVATLTDALDGSPIIGVPIAIVGSSAPFFGFRPRADALTGPDGSVHVTVADPNLWSSYTAFFGGSGGEHASASHPVHVARPVHLRLRVGSVAHQTATKLVVASPRGYPFKVRVQQFLRGRWEDTSLAIVLKPVGTTSTVGEFTQLRSYRIRLRLHGSRYFADAFSNELTVRVVP